MTRIACGLCFLLLAGAAAGQTSLGTSSVGGEVRDSSGLPISGAQVELTDLQRGVARRTVTNSAGNYQIPGVPAGLYALKIQKAGFADFSVTNFQVVVNQSVTYNATLQVGQVSQSVAVNAEGAAPLLDTDSNSLGTLVDQARVESLPLNGRNFLQLGLIAAGAQQPQGASDGISAQNGHPERAIHIAGNFAGVTSYMIDGVETRGSRLGESALNVSIADVDQFKVQMSFFMPDQGPGPGIVNVYTKSGTNTLHGQAFEFIRNSVFDARNFFSPGPERLQRNQFGFDLGGPVVIPRVVHGKDRLWFHVYYEGERQLQKFSQSAFTPTAAMFGGNFAEVPQTIYNPFTTDPNTGARQPFPNNQIPANLINPVSKKLLPYYLPGSSFSQRPNLFATPANSLNDDQFGTRLDTRISDRQMLFANFMWENSPAVAASLMPLTGRFFPLDTQLAVVQHTFTISPRLVNLARIGFSRSSTFTRGQPGPTPTFANDLGFQGTDDPTGFPGMNIQGFTGFGSPTGLLGDVDNNYQIDEGLNYIRGNHTFQFGLGVRYHRSEQLNANADARGTLFFQPTFTAQLVPNASGQLVPAGNSGNAFADFLLGLPAQGRVLGLPPIYYRFTQYMPYIQDSWKVARGLTINWGLSWYHSTVPDPQGAARNMVAALNFQTGLLMYSALGQVNPELMSPTYTDFTPRFGFAWQPSFAPNTVLRAGIGVYYDDSRLIEAQNAFQAPPFTNPTTFINPATSPTYVLGQNVLPVIPLPPLNADFAQNLPPGFGPNLLSQTSKDPYVTQWNVALQHTFTPNNMFEIDYMGASGHRQQNRYDADQCVPGPDLLCNPATRPYLRYNLVLMFDNNGNMNYQALALKYHHQFSHGLTFRGEYTYSKILTDSYEGNLATESQITTCQRCDRGPGAFDVPQSLVLSTVYDLPFGRNRFLGAHWSKPVDLLLGGWEATGITTFSTGNAFTINAPNTTTSQFADLRANRLCDGRSSQLAGNLRSDGMLYFNTNCFVSPLPAHFGDSGRGVMIGPGINNWDLGLWKSFPIHENTRLEFRAELFNAFNHAQFADPHSNTGDLQFGYITAARSPRLVQFALKLLW